MTNVGKGRKKVGKGRKRVGQAQEKGKGKGATHHWRGLRLKILLPPGL